MVIKHHTGVRIFPKCRIPEIGSHVGFIQLKQLNGKFLHKPYYCFSNENPYIGGGRWYVHHEKPAFLVRNADMMCMGTVDELEKFI